MTLEQQVLNRFRTLPPASQQEVLNFVEFLATRLPNAPIDDENESPEDLLDPAESFRQGWQDAREGRTTPIRAIISRLKAE
jgi:hypothetical protein